MAHLAGPSLKCAMTMATRLGLTPVCSVTLYKGLSQRFLGRLKNDIKDLKAGQIETRMQLHSMDGNVLRQERTMAALQVKVDRIETRLDFTDH